MKSIILTFDIEEFDYPRNVGIKISEKEKYEISYKGVKEILRLLDKHGITATFFVTANFALKYPKLIKEISKKHEVASHGYNHEWNYNEISEDFALNDIKKARIVLEKIIGKKVYGFRAPKFMRPKVEIIKKAGFKYDSSINPIYLPGHYNNFFKSRKMYSEDGLKVIPVSATPLIRLPLFWIAARNFGLAYMKLCSRLCLINNNQVNLLFHSWEFVDIDRKRFSKLGKLSIRNTGKPLINLLDSYIKWGKKLNLKFLSMSEYLNIAHE